MVSVFGMDTGRLSPPLLRDRFFRATVKSSIVTSTKVSREKLANVTEKFLCGTQFRTKNSSVTFAVFALKKTSNPGSDGLYNVYPGFFFANIRRPTVQQFIFRLDIRYPHE
jgi:hypothetical protein